MLDLILKNGRVMDGTGNPWFFGDVGIKDGVIADVGRVDQRSRETIDVRSQAISPGFIDGHCHSDLMVLDEPLSEIKLQQGVTTEVLGNCGMTPAPFTPQNLDLLLEQDGKVSIVFFHMDGSDVEQVMRWDRSLIASDSLHNQAEKPHPRLYGTFPRVLARYVREDGVLTLEEAIRKMSSFPARRFKLGKRGLVAPGYAADLVVFDPGVISDRATYDDPKRFPEGISCVLVNGTKVVESGVHRGAREGRTIERS